MSENVQKRIKKKRTIANLLQTEKSLSIPNEKKTYIKEYFEQCTTPPKTPEPAGQQTDFISPMSNSSRNDADTPEIENLPSETNHEATESLKNAKKSKVKDYVFDYSPRPLKGTIFKMTNKIYEKTVENSPKSFQRKRVTRVSKRKSKIKDYIIPGTKNQDNEANSSIEIEDVKSTEQEEQIEIINNTIPMIPIIKPKILHITNETNTEFLEPILFDKLKPKRTKIKDYMISSDSSMVLSKTTKNLENGRNFLSKKISNMPTTGTSTSTVSNLMFMSKNNSQTSENLKVVTRAVKNDKKIINIFPQRLVKRNLFKTVKDQQTKSTIKEYLQSQMLQTKSSRAKLIKNKENLSQIKNKNSNQFLLVKN